MMPSLLWKNPLSNNTPTADIKPNIPAPVQEEEWMWVNGYKGVESDMTAYGGFKYSVGETYTATGPVIPCENGFHFCLELENVVKNWFRFNMERRYFKVRALVRLNDLKQYQKGADKLVAKEIQLVEEVPFEDFWPFVDRERGFSWIDTDEEALKAYQIGYRQLAMFKARSMLTGKYSDTFITLMLATHCHQPEGWSPTCDQRYQVPRLSFVRKMIALADEGLSPDMRAYLLMK